MTDRRKIGSAAGALTLGLALSSGAAFAQTPTHAFGHGAPLKGVIQNLNTSASTFQMTTGSSTVTVAYNKTTRVELTVSGSTADLTKGAHVHVALGTNGTTVKAVMVLPAVAGNGARGQKSGSGTAWSGHHGAHAGKTDSGKNRAGTPKSGSAPKPGSAGPRHSGAGKDNADGMVVGFDTATGTLKLQTHGGQTVSVAVSANVPVTKIVAGDTSKLANNETVQVFAVNGVARFIDILSA